VNLIEKAHVSGKLDTIKGKRMNIRKLWEIPNYLFTSVSFVVNSILDMGVDK